MPENKIGPGGATNTVTRGLAPQEGAEMKRNPYRADVESVVFEERDWCLECQVAAAERDHWQDRAYLLERRLEQAQAKARRASANVCSASACMRPASRRSRVGLCDLHTAMAHDDMELIWREQMLSEPDVVPEHVRRRMECAAQPWVVYYIQVGENIKIGRTTNLLRRMQALCAQPEQLLAVEPGVVVDGVNREIERHREFAEWRIPGTELFTPNAALHRHIQTAVAMFGDPSQHVRSS